MAFDLGAVGPGLAEKGENLVVVLACGAGAESSAADGVGGVDAGVDGEAGGGDVAACLEVARRASANSSALAA